MKVMNKLTENYNIYENYLNRNAMLSLNKAEDTVDKVISKTI